MGDMIAGKQDGTSIIVKRPPNSRKIYIMYFTLWPIHIKPGSCLSCTFISSVMKCSYPQTLVSISLDGPDVVAPMTPILPMFPFNFGLHILRNVQCNRKTFSPHPSEGLG